MTQPSPVDETVAPFFHNLLMRLGPIRTGDPALDKLAAHLDAYRGAHNPDVCTLLAVRCETNASVIDTEIASVYQQLAALARWRANRLERNG